MKKLSSCLWGILITIFLFNGNIYATTLSNFGFEAGNFSGWDIVSGTALVVDSYAGDHGTYAAAHGTYFAIMSNSTIFEQHFTITEGSTIYGNSAFDANGDYWGKVNDGASVQIYFNGTSIAMPWYMDSATMWVQIGNNRQTPWQNWSWTAPSSGTYTVRMRLLDYGTIGSRALFDAPQTINAVPEPATMLLFGTGIACLAGARIRRKKK